MNALPQFDHVVAYLGPVLTRLQASDDWETIVVPKDAVLAHFQPLFHQNHLTHLTETELRPFFYFEHNCHWTTLARQVNRICGAMPSMRQAMMTLANEDLPIQQRFDEAKAGVHGLGKRHHQCHSINQAPRPVWSVERDNRTCSQRSTRTLASLSTWSLAWRKIC